MTRYALLATLAMLFGCNNSAQSPVPQEDIDLSANVQSYDAAVEDREGTYDHLALTITEPQQHEGTHLSFRVPPGELPYDSPVESPAPE